MKQFRTRSTVTWVLVIPTVAWYYIGLFLTMFLWYPNGLSLGLWESHILHFSIIYVLWLIVFFSYRLFDWDALRSSQAYFGRLFAALVLALIIAVLYFYFQPALLITPRRFLITHLIVTGIGISIWYAFMRRVSERTSGKPVYIHSAVPSSGELQALISTHRVRGLEFVAIIDNWDNFKASTDSIIVMPSHTAISSEEAKGLFSLRTQGVRFIEYTELFEELVRAVHLAALSDLWFVNSIDYGSHIYFDIIKRIFDITLSLLAALLFVLTFPFIALGIMLTSKGPVFFKQNRVGLDGKTFVLYKYRTMEQTEANNTWTAPGDSRITTIGRFLRAARLDELPQTWNILKGDMSIVGPRPEQVNIVAELEQQIPYYNERHLVKPGLTGWAQLHVYAGSLEETKRKLQYDLYYIKHRSLLFDIEIILKTVYNIVTFAGR